ncbi:hypothetical protein K2224_28665 (plasmid) [Streptomyces sp. BHT-5-2]|uniref:recombination directionality factor n=1 Tax=Streptomyces sp. BHT-5-2 TaxID=2866715 RepID=UPI001C8E1BBB|nr:hypothetical protein [Streptomyces sp. BHT-5-2]QZL07257.1 hypothetical protein K2224_28665 [Streptomyces sp. BHT-5-2]
MVAEGIGSGTIVGRFRAEEERQDGQPVACPGWLLTTQGEEVAALVTGLYGGRPRSCNRKPGTFEVVLEKDAIAVTVDGPSSVINHLVLGERHDPIHVCNGSAFLAPMDSVGHPCGCPESAFARKAAARSGRGPKPDARLTFRLAAAPDAGLFGLSSSSWTFYESLSAAADAMERANAKARMEIRLQRKVVTTRSGMTVSYVHPAFSIVERESAAPGDLQLAA